MHGWGGRSDAYYFDSRRLGGMGGGQPGFHACQDTLSLTLLHHFHSRALSNPQPPSPGIPTRRR